MQFVVRLLALLLFAAPAIYFLERGLRDGPRSRRLANLALVCGLSFMILPEYAFGWSPSVWPMYFRGSAVCRVLLGIAGVVLAGAAFFARSDKGVGLAKPILAAGFSLWHLMSGAGMLWFFSLAAASAPWVYQSPDNGYQLTLPATQWKQVQDPLRVGFACRVPRMQAFVVEVKKNQTEDDFARATEDFRARLTSSQQLSSPTNFQQGTNVAGNPYHYCVGMVATPDGKPVYLASSITWSFRKQMIVVLLFEGLLRMSFETGKAAEMEAFERSAETICLSVD